MVRVGRDATGTPGIPVDGIPGTNRGISTKDLKGQERVQREGHQGDKDQRGKRTVGKEENADDGEKDGKTPR